jgi:hypothetical protein
MSANDPRRGLASASAMYRVSKCPGSVALVKSLRASGKYIPIADPYAKSGTKTHFFLANQVVQQPGAPALEEIQRTLNSDELIVARKSVQLRNGILDQWHHESTVDGPEPIKYLVEQRLWYRNRLTPRFSGQADLTAINGNGKRALIFDYKTGRIEAEPAADNLQLRAEVVLHKHKWPELEEIDGTIIEPLVTWESERVSYSGDSLGQAEQEILEIVSAAEWPKAKRYAGPWCVHCAARANCQECLDYVQSTPNPESMTDAIVELPRGDLGVRLWERIKLAKKLLETLEATYTKIMESEPGALPGFVLPEIGKERRRVVQPALLKERFAQYLTPADLDGCAEYSLPKIEELIGIKHNLQGKALAKTFAPLFEDCHKSGAVTITNDRPFIRPLTKREKEEMKKQIEAK